MGSEYLVTCITRGGLLSGLSSPTICDCPYQLFISAVVFLMVLDVDVCQSRLLILLCCMISSTISKTIKVLIYTLNKSMVYFLFYKCFPETDRLVIFIIKY